LSKGPCSHRETWWWNEEIAIAVGKEEKVSKLEERKLDRDTERVQEE